jgi:hypothetical protein
MAEQQKGHGHGNAGTPYKTGEGGKGHNWPKPGDPNTKGWSEKVGKGHTAPKPK